MSDPGLEIGFLRVVSILTADHASCRAALEAAGVEFIDENGGGAGVRMRKG